MPLGAEALRQKPRPCCLRRVQNEFHELHLLCFLGRLPYFTASTLRRRRVAARSADEVSAEYETENEQHHGASDPHRHHAPTCSAIFDVAATPRYPAHLLLPPLESTYGEGKKKAHQSVRRPPSLSSVS